MTAVAPAPSADPVSELWTAADSWERRRSGVPRAVTTEAEARLAAAVRAMRGKPEKREIGICARCGEPVDLDAKGPCTGVRKAKT